MRDDSAAFRHVMASRVEDIAAFAAEFEEWAGAAGVPAKAVMHVNLMLDELITNVIQYGYANSPTGEVRIDVNLRPGTLEVLLTDHAFAYDPLQARAPDLESDIEEREVGGLGVHFVRTLADEVAYERVADGGREANRLRIVKRF